MGAGSTFSQGANTNTTNPYGGTQSPYFGAAQAQTLGNLAGAQQAVQANRVNQVTPYGNLNYSQQTDAIWQSYMDSYTVFKPRITIAYAIFFTKFAIKSSKPYVWY